MSIENFGGRKYLLSLLTVILGFVLVLASKVEAAEFMSFIKWVLGIYVVGNAASKAVSQNNP